MNLHEYTLIIINSSAGKDSLASMWEINRMAQEQNFPADKIFVSHQCLGKMEWPGTRELAERQARKFGWGFEVSKYRDAAGQEISLLEYAEKRGKWPAKKQRWCTSEFKRGAGARVVTKLTKGLGDCKVLHVFGFRAQESADRAKKQTLVLNTRISSKKRKVYDYLPIHNWSSFEVWATIKGAGLEYHPAYDLGMPRLSCVFCSCSPFQALVIAGKHNPQLLDEYVKVEAKIGHTFTAAHSLAEVKAVVEAGAIVESVEDWVM